MSKYASIVIAIIILGLFSGCLWTGPEIVIKRYDTPPGEYTELTGEELKENPALEKAMSGEGCKKFDENSWSCKLDTDELSRTMDFTNEKRYKYLFSLDGIVEKDLNKGIITEELRNEFESRGFPLSKNARQARQLSEIIYRGDGKWEIGDQNYKIWKKDRKLNVYDPVSYYLFFKAGEKYYELAYLTD